MSLGRMRLVIGPLSWLTHAPILARLPFTPSLGVSFAGATVLATAAASGLVAPHDAVSAAPLHVAAPAHVSDRRPCDAADSTRRPPAGPFREDGIRARAEQGRQGRREDQARLAHCSASGEEPRRHSAARGRRRRAQRERSRPVARHPGAASRAQPRTPRSDDTDVAHPVAVRLLPPSHSCPSTTPRPLLPRRSPRLHRRSRRTSPRRSPPAPTRVSSRMLRHNRSRVGPQRSHPARASRRKASVSRP